MRTLPEPREFMLIESSTLRQSVGAALATLGHLRNCPSDLRKVLEEMSAKMWDGALTNKDIDALFEAGRRCTWKYHDKAVLGSQPLEAAQAAVEERGKIATIVMMLGSALLGVPGTAHQRRRLP